MDIKLFDRILALGNLIGQAKLAYIETNKDFQITSWNNGATKIFGHSEDETLGRYLGDLLPFDKEEYDFSKQTFEVSIPNKNIPGKISQCEIHYCPIINQQSQKLGLAVLVRKTPQDELKLRLLESQFKYLEEIYQYAPIGIFHVDMNGQLVDANSEFAWMLGYESKEMLVNQITDFATQIFFDMNRAEEFMVKLFETDKVAKFRCRLKRRGTSSYLWSLCFAKSTFDDSGKKNGFSGYAVDIRETIKAENDFKRANRKLKQLSVLDALTQIFNRRKFDRSLGKEWKRHVRSKEELSIILCDIDYFKKYNDTYGHQAGDDCLIRVAKTIENSVHRSTDLAARYGGEEFAVILPGTGCKGAECVAENIRVAIQNLEIEHQSSEVSPFVSLSLGTATLVPELDSSHETLLLMADKALYQSKETGRNKYSVFQFVD